MWTRSGKEELGLGERSAAIQTLPGFSGGSEAKTHRQAEVCALSHSVVSDFLPSRRCGFNPWAGKIP